MAIDRKDLTIDTVSNNSGVVQMTITHRPTGVFVRAIGKGNKYHIEQMLMRDLENKMNAPQDQD